MSRKLFTVEYNYGGLIREYRIDQLGKPYVVETRYEMIFHGWGDHEGTPGAFLGTEEYEISFSELREAAERANETAFQNINENNWEEIASVAAQKRKRKRRH